MQGRVSPVHCIIFVTIPFSLRREVFRCCSKFCTSSVAFVHVRGTRLLLFPLARPFWRRGKIHFMLRSGNSLALSLKGTSFDALLRTDFSLRRHPSYGASWHFPRLDFHQLDNACLAGHATQWKTCRKKGRSWHVVNAATGYHSATSTLDPVALRPRFSPGLPFVLLICVLRYYIYLDRRPFPHTVGKHHNNDYDGKKNILYQGCSRQIIVCWIHWRVQ